MKRIRRLNNMNHTVAPLVALREKISKVDGLLACDYVDLDTGCLCAVGHVFTMGGITPEKLHEELNDLNGESVFELFEHDMYEKLAAKAGFEFEEDKDFLHQLQQVNDNIGEFGEKNMPEVRELRKNDVLEFLDKEIAKHKTDDSTVL